jgi:hypothetical protein
VLPDRLRGAGADASVVNDPEAPMLLHLPVAVPTKGLQVTRRTFGLEASGLGKAVTGWVLAERRHVMFPSLVTSTEMTFEKR